ncbi:MAG: pilus assembly protein [Hyphomonas sp.]|nr:pilus assembly protein [Hyphomonas sp.]HRX73093.1 pilus assembly protein [Hyphomonas sp.]
MNMRIAEIEAVVNRWRRDKRGNITILMALIVVAILGLAGVAIDLRYTISQKEKVQYALDSAVLAGALDRQRGADAAGITAEVRNYAGALIGEAGGGLTCTQINVVMDDVSEDIAADIRCSQPTFVSQIIGYDELAFNVSSTSTYSVGKVDVAFVFDVSGSMNSYNRLSLLKTAANAAFDTLLPDDMPDDKTIRIAIATYNNAVNAGPYATQVTNQVTLAADASNTAASANYNNYNGRRMYDQATGKRFFYYQTGTCLDYGTCDRNSNWSWSPARRFYNDVSVDRNCVFERTGAQAATDAAPGSSAWIGMGNPEWNFSASSRNKYDGWQEVAYGGADSTSKGAFSNNFARCENSEPVPLTDNKDTLKAAVNAMTASNGTAGHLGIAWGWYLISPNWSSIWPSESKPWAYDEVNATKAIILMTDGDFNSQHPSAGKGSFQQAMDLCDSMKASPSKVTVYTVGFQVPDTVQKTGDGRTILEYCATSPAFAYSAADGDQLLQVYKEIAQSIADLRIKK